MKRLDDLLCIGGSLTIAVGVGMIHVPSGVIAAGVAAVVAAVFVARSVDSKPGREPEGG